MNSADQGGSQGGAATTGTNSADQGGSQGGAATSAAGTDTPPASPVLPESVPSPKPKGKKATKADGVDPAPEPEGKKATEADGAASETKKAREVRELLETMGLQIYSDAVLENGWESAELIRALDTEQMQVLVTTVKMKPGHGHKLVIEMKKLKQQQQQQQQSPRVPRRTYSADYRLGG
eukprot:COSAG02_NODE_19622_length_872_cov_29718.538163_1_plen_178_part_01